MRLTDRIHRAEQQVAVSSQRSADRAKAGAKEIRKQIGRGLHAVAQHLPMSIHLDAQERVEAPPTARDGIVSVDGRDVEKMHCTGHPRAN